LIDVEELPAPGSHIAFQHISSKPNKHLATHQVYDKIATSSGRPLTISV
jgi:hypothetical protein